MKIDKFYDYIEGITRQTYIVQIKLKYGWEDKYRFTNEIMGVNENFDFYWENDWDEGETDVEVIGIIALDDITEFYVPCKSVYEGE